MAKPDIIPGGGADFQFIRFQKGEEIPVMVSNFIDKSGKLVLASSATPVCLKPLHPVYRDPTTGQEVVSDVSI